MDYFAVYKPYGMLSQFSPEGNRPVLGELMDFPKDVYPVGRLDADSEGLLLLTNDKRLNAALLNPKNRHGRTYWAQVEGSVTEEALERLRNGVEIRIKGKTMTTARAEARRIAPPELPPRNPPIRFRKNVPDEWLEIRIAEGKNRQVRRMAAAVGFPVLRLARYALEDMTLGGMKPGETRTLTLEEIRQTLKLYI